jgi:hypothetical protein
MRHLILSLLFVALVLIREQLTVSLGHGRRGAMESDTPPSFRTATKEDPDEEENTTDTYVHREMGDEENDVSVKDVNEKLVIEENESQEKVERGRFGECRGSILTVAFGDQPYSKAFSLALLSNLFLKTTSIPFQSFL